MLEATETPDKQLLTEAEESKDGSGRNGQQTMIIDTMYRQSDCRLAAPVELLGIPLEDNDVIEPKQPNHL